ncbi:hypothetical protein CFC21_000573 [Triticum aestivum]|uniref:Uncharacterized protein n=1 Tax=Triticum aestivum TaxID=4565 RepID=A0A3B5XUA6_WHEAT|nr:hypothetical protein CFC21_000573 [Triticum aestivum]
MAAAALLPPLLPTPPRSEMLPILPTPPKSEMLPLLPTPHGLVLTMSTDRAGSVERWDADKKYKKPRTIMSSSSYSAGSPGRADSVERWDSKKLAPSCSASPPTDRGRHDGDNKRLPSPSRGAAATTPAQATTPQKTMFAGPNFHASPDPSMLPMPSFFLLARSRALCTSN